MSAYQVSDRQIRVLAVAYVRATQERCDMEQATATARLLWEANSESLRARYGDGCEGEPPVVESLGHWDEVKRLSPVQVIKLCQNFDYQACEYDGWPASRAKQVIDTVMWEACHRLPGYDTAGWGL